MALEAVGYGFGSLRQINEHCFEWGLIRRGSARTTASEQTSRPITYRGHVFFVELWKRDGHTKFCIGTHMTQSDNHPYALSYKLTIVGSRGEKLWRSRDIESTFGMEDGVTKGEYVLLPSGKASKVKEIVESSSPVTRCFLRLKFVLEGQGEAEGDKRRKPTLAQCNDWAELSENLKTLLQDEEGFDVTLDVSARSFQAHKLILMARSPVFNRMFRSHMVEQSSGRVEILDCDPAAFEVYLQFLYSGNSEGITADNVGDLFYIANKYDSSTLGRRCLEYMIQNMLVENFCDFLPAVLASSSSSSSEETRFLESTVQFFADHFEEVGQSSKWKDFFKANASQAHELLMKACKELASRSEMTQSLLY